MAGQDGSRPVSARGRFYVQCLANATTQLTEGGSTGGLAGDELDWVWFCPATLTPGAMSILDGATIIWPWPAGITLTDLRPIFVPLNLRSRNGAWNVLCPANVTATAAGAFS